VSQGTERQAVSGSGQAGVSNPGQCHKVQNGRQAQGHCRQNGENRDEREKQEYRKNAGRLVETRRSGNRQTENIGINAQGGLPSVAVV
jgi:hypothetical protein